MLQMSKRKREGKKASVDLRCWRKRSLFEHRHGKNDRKKEMLGKHCLGVPSLLCSKLGCLVFTPTVS